MYKCSTNAQIPPPDQYLNKERTKGEGMLNQLEDKGKEILNIPYLHLLLIQTVILRLSKLKFKNFFNI